MRIVFSHNGTKSDIFCPTGRAGYGASLEGLVCPNLSTGSNIMLTNASYKWPYTYDSCDVGTAPNQTFQGQPEAALVNGDAAAGGALSFLPGQRLSKCTCPGESHPGPVHKDGSFVGRAAPEIDVFEAQVRMHCLMKRMVILTLSDYWGAIDWPSFTISSVGGKYES